MSKMHLAPSCAACAVEDAKKICRTEAGTASRGCPTLKCRDVLTEANREYEAHDLGNFACQASLQESACYANRHVQPYVMQPTKTRMVEIHDDQEAMCNPVFQARLMNLEKTHFNILLGLCVGHDSMFFKYAEAPVTVLAVKDRVTGHNPLAAIYLAHSYFRKIKKPNLC